MRGERYVSKISSYSLVNVVDIQDFGCLYSLLNRKMVLCTLHFVFSDQFPSILGNLCAFVKKAT